MDKGITMIYTKQYISDLESVQKCIPDIKQLQNCSIMVTGAGGLIGSAIMDFLIHANDTLQLNMILYAAARNWEKIRKRFGAVADRRDFVYVPYDAMKPFSMEAPLDYVIHTASPANPGMYASHPVETMLANLMGVNALLDYARTHELKRILYLSSSEVYGKKKDRKPYEEEEYGYVDILNPRGCYPVAKRGAETLLASYLQEYGVKSVIARPGHVYGPTGLSSDNRASTSFFRDVVWGRDILMKSPGQQLRSYCYVADCVSGVLCSMLHGIIGQAYNISNPSSVATIRELAEQIALVSGRRILFEQPTDREAGSYNRMEHSDLKGAKLEQLGWKGLFDLKTGVRHTYEIMKENSSAAQSGCF